MASRKAGDPCSTILPTSAQDINLLASHWLILMTWSSDWLAGKQVITASQFCPLPEQDLSLHVAHW
ncbi:MAG: hypothetical protein ACK559_25250, partial [bacterium]